MKKKISSDIEDGLRPEYDLTKLLKGGIRGKYVARYRAGTNVVLLAPDVAQAFPTEDAVNEALRLVMRMAQIPIGIERSSAQKQNRLGSAAVYGQVLAKTEDRQGGCTGDGLETEREIVGPKELGLK